MDTRAHADNVSTIEGNETLTRVERVSLSENIYERLHDFILTGRIKPGSRIIEERLAEQLGTSRAPLREAIWRLRGDGLVTGFGRDTRVVCLQAEDIRELHLLRTSLETLLYQSAASNVTTKIMVRLEWLVENMLTAAANSERKRLSELDYEFHQTLARASSLPRAYRVWCDQHMLFRLWLNMVAETEDDAEEIAAHHSLLLEAVKSREPDAIAHAIVNHIYDLGRAFASERSEWKKERAIIVGDAKGLAAWQKDAKKE